MKLRIFVCLAFIPAPIVIAVTRSSWESALFLGGMAYTMLAVLAAQLLDAERESNEQ